MKTKAVLEGTGLKVSAIVPAYNEEHTIGEVLSVLTACHQIHEVIVVSDGSTDNTVKVAKDYDAKVIDLSQNIGKGGAMKVGSKYTDADILLFIDADLLGLTSEHINRMLKPVLDNEVAMTVGLFEEGRLATDLAQKLAPFLSGQRAMIRSVMDEIQEADAKGFGIEMALSRYVEKNQIPVQKVYLTNMGQIMKEEKMGFCKGFLARLRMYWEIFRSLR